jgi:hypothetical protein
MHLLLFIGYSLLIVFGLLKFPFIRNSGIRPVFVVIFFALHVFTGLLHNWIAWRYFPGHGDIWQFYEMSFLYRTRLLTDFSQFMADNSTLTYITHNGIIGIHMLLNILSRDNMTINTLLFSLPIFLGNMALFRVFRGRFSGAPAAALTVVILPSTLFWTACIHREGVLYMLLGLLVYAFDQWLIAPRQHRRSLVYCVLYMTLILYFRFYIILSLLPALFVWLLAERPSLTRRLLPPVLAVLLLAIALNFVFPTLSGRFARAITARQLDFSQLEGNSRLPLPLMTGTWASIFKVLPAGLRNGFFEPLPGSGGKALYLAFAAELILIWTSLFISLIWRRARPAGVQFPRPGRQPFISFCLIFSLSGMLIVGAMVPFAGAIVRYRSVFLPFLFGPALYWLKTFPVVNRLDRWLEKHLLIPTPSIN